MKKIRKFLAGFLALTLALSVNSHTILWAKNSDAMALLSAEVPNDVIEYAIDVFPHMAYPVGDDWMFSLSEMPDVVLGSPAMYYDLENNTLVETNKYIFPVLLDGEIVASLEVFDGQDGPSASFYGSEILRKLSESMKETKKPFALVSDISRTMAVNEDKAVLLFDLQLTESETESSISVRRNTSNINTQNISSETTEMLSNAENAFLTSDSAVQEAEVTDLLTPIASMPIISPQIEAKAAGYPSSYRLDVDPVYQDGPICGAAAMAAIINYICGENLDSKEVNEGACGSETSAASTAELQDYAYDEYDLDSTRASNYPSASRAKEYTYDNDTPIWQYFSIPAGKSAHALAQSGWSEAGGRLYYVYVTTWSGYNDIVSVSYGTTFSYGGHTMTPGHYLYGFD